MLLDVLCYYLSKVIYGIAKILKSRYQVLVVRLKFSLMTLMMSELLFGAINSALLGCWQWSLMLMAGLCSVAGSTLLCCYADTTVMCCWRALLCCWQCNTFRSAVLAILCCADGSALVCCDSSDLLCCCAGRTLQCC
jgi:hypothetical protein